MQGCRLSRRKSSSQGEFVVFESYADELLQKKENVIYGYN